VSRWVRTLPLLVVALLVGLLLWRLVTPQASDSASRLVGQPVPQFTLPQAVPGKPALASSALRAGRPRLLNIFASWCVPCIAEAPVLAELRSRGVAIDGIAIRDRPRDVAAFLQRNGDPFDRIGSDDNSRVQLALGSSGVPESFVIDGQGVIRYHHVGEIRRDQIPLILAELEKSQ
jgi:cytochrome c biogenesis protein CcmG/thiol:disulfide interchange protein DsbE